MEITKELFEKFCPVALSPDSQIFDAVSTRFDDNIEFIKSEVLTDELWEIIFGDEPVDYMYQLVNNVRKYVCVSAFLDTLPHLDLVLTETGFGIVSNGNVAPASSDRVERLQKRLLHDKDDAFEEILDAARRDYSWGNSANATRWISSLFWNRLHLRFFNINARTRSELIEKKVEIDSGEAWLKNLISPEFFEEMCEWERHNAENILGDRAMYLARLCVATYICRPESVSLQRRLLIGFLEEHPEEFTTYFSSAAYRANHFKPYENKKDDPCYFFG